MKPIFLALLLLAGTNLIAEVWLGAGTAEERFHTGTVAVHEALTRAGIRSVFYSSNGTDHEWQTWRRSLHDFAPRLFRDLN